MLKDKTILLICKETFSFPMYFLGKELEKKNNVHYFFIMHGESLNKNNFNKNTYFFFKNNINSEKIHDVKDIYLKFIKNRDNISIDYSRLKEIETKYTFFTSLNKQLLSSQSTSTPYHDRFYYPPSTYEENLYWLMLNYDKAEKILEKIKPDCIFDLDTTEIQRTIINEIANYKKIPYIAPEHSRYKSFVLPIFNLGRDIDNYFINTYNKNKNLNSLELKDYIDEIKNYRAQLNIIPEIYKNDITSKYDYSFFETLKILLRKSVNFFRNQIYSFSNDKNKVPSNSTFNSNPYKRFLFLILEAVKRFYLLSKFNRYFQSPIQEKYIYFPLHLVPESSTFVKIPLYVNELLLLEAISKSLPINWKLYVKEHQSMIGQRNIDFYKKASKFHNVKIVKNNFYKDPKPWIEKSLGVVTITGTSAFEASMLNKPAIVFGKVFYNVISGIKFVNNIEKLEQMFKLIETGNWNKDNTIDCAVYLKTIKELGTYLDIRSLIKLSQKKITCNFLNVKDKNDLNHKINSLINFYEKGLHVYSNSKKNLNY